MKGWLIVNEYLKTGKFLELQELFLKAAKARNVELQVHSINMPSKNAYIPCTRFP